MGGLLLEAPKGRITLRGVQKQNPDIIHTHTHSVHTLQLQYFSNSFVEISAYLPSPAKCDTFPD